MCPSAGLLCSTVNATEVSQKYKYNIPVQRFHFDTLAYLPVRSPHFPRLGSQDSCTEGGICRMTGNFDFRVASCAGAHLRLLNNQTLAIFTALSTNLENINYFCFSFDVIDQLSNLKSSRNLKEREVNYKEMSVECLECRHMQAVSRWKTRKS